VHIVEGWDDGRMPRSTALHPDYIAAAVRDVMWEPLPINSDPWAVRRRFHRRFVLPRQLSSLLCLVCAASRVNSKSPFHLVSSFGTVPGICTDPSSIHYSTLQRVPPFLVAIHPLNVVPGASQSNRATWTTLSGPLSCRKQPPPLVTNLFNQGKASKIALGELRWAQQE
jgi:hypothetical protein